MARAPKIALLRYQPSWPLDSWVCCSVRFMETYLNQISYSLLSLSLANFLPRPRRIMINALPSQLDFGLGVVFSCLLYFSSVSGPGFNLFLRETNFYIGPFIVDKYSSPGVRLLLPPSALWNFHSNTSADTLILFCSFSWQLCG